MSEQVIAALIGAAVVGALKIVDRLLDYLFPPGHHLPHLPWVEEKEGEDAGDGEG